MPIREYAYGVTHQLLTGEVRVEYRIVSDITDDTFQSLKTLLDRQAIQVFSVLVDRMVQGHPDSGRPVTVTERIGDVGTTIPIEVNVVLTLNVEVDIQVARALIRVIFNPAHIVNFIDIATNADQQYTAEIERGDFDRELRRWLGSANDGDD